MQSSNFSQKTYTVYLGSSGYARTVFKEAAIETGRLIGAQNHSLVYGGMDAGLMGLVAQAALDSGAHVTGIIPEKIKDSERILRGLSETVMVHDLWDRKKRMFMMADVVVSLPGGFGTLDETLEMLYWGALKLHDKPLVLVNIEGFWNPLMAYLRSLPDFDPRYVALVDTPEEIFSMTQNLSLPKADRGRQDRFPHFEDEISRNTAAPIWIDRPSIENSYYLVCALGLKQLGKHKRPIGILNEGGVFDDLIAWFHTAQKERFITDKCLRLFDAAGDAAALHKALERQSLEAVEIDLHAEKWGASVIGS
ncbi:MAG: TIGR00730 family Rossman fold protein [Alphaproteobacteria bacterium]